MMDYRTLYRNSLENPEKFWAEIAAELVWTKPWDKVIDDSDALNYEWFSCGAKRAPNSVAGRVSSTSDVVGTGTLHASSSWAVFPTQPPMAQWRPILVLPAIPTQPAMAVCAPM